MRNRRFLYSVSRPAYVTVRDNEDSYEISHIYELRNQGPSPLPEADLMVEYPQVQVSGSAQLRLNSTEVGLDFFNLFFLISNTLE